MWLLLEGNERIVRDADIWPAREHEEEGVELFKGIRGRSSIGDEKGRLNRGLIAQETGS